MEYVLSKARVEGHSVKTERRNNKKEKKKILVSQKSTRHQIVEKYLWKGLEWMLVVFVCFLFAKGMYNDASNNEAVSVVSKVIILFTVSVSIYSWKKIATSRLAVSRKEEHLFYHKKVLAIIISFIGAITGNPWLLFFLTSRSLNAHLFVLMLFTHITIWGSMLFIKNAAIRQIIAMYPIIATFIVNFEEILSEKGTNCTYEKSRKYLLGLSMTFISFCIIEFCFSPYAKNIIPVFLNTYD